jgi:hypothetical protein
MEGHMAVVSVSVRRLASLASLVASCLLFPVGTSHATSVGAVPQITVLASNTGLIIVHYTPAGALVTMDAVLEVDAAVPSAADVYVGILSPDGQSASWAGNPQAPILVKGPPVPLLANVVLTAGASSSRLVIPNFAAGGPPGWYVLYGLVVVAGRNPNDPKQWFSSSFFPLLVTPLGTQ